jgi:hypothetical protein
MKQHFFNKETTTINKDVVVRNKRDGVFTDRDVAVCKFLFKHKFATLSQINTVITAQGFEPMKKDKAKNLCQNRLINKFVFSDEDRINFDDENLNVIYCMDLGGRYLLEQYAPGVDVTSWLVGRNAYSKDYVSRIIIVNEIYIKLMATRGEDLLSFNVLKEVRMGRDAIQIDFDFNLRAGDTVRYYMGNLFMEDEIYDLFGQKMRLIESLVVTNGWKKYSMNNETTEPAVFIIGENNTTTSKLASKVYDCGLNLNGKDRYSTFERILKYDLYDKETFLKFEANETQRGFKKAMISNFLPKEKETTQA